jgi:hypothetical protein
MNVFEGPYIIIKLLDHSAYELRNEIGKLRGEFNQKHLRLYQEADDETQINKWSEVVTADARTNHRSKKKRKSLRRKH